MTSTGSGISQVSLLTVARSSIGRRAIGDSVTRDTGGSIQSVRGLCSSLFSDRRHHWSRVYSELKHTVSYWCCYPVLFGSRERGFGWAPCWLDPALISEWGKRCSGFALSIVPFCVCLQQRIIMAVILHRSPVMLPGYRSEMVCCFQCT